MDLFRTKSVLAWTVLLSGAMTVAACSGDEPKDMGMNGNGDAGGGLPDAPDTMMDMGVPDGGRPDTGRVDGGRPDPCPNGTEGCECTTTSTVFQYPFKQEDCQAGLKCVEFDLLSGLRTGGPNPQLEGPVKS